MTSHASSHLPFTLPTDESVSASDEASSNTPDTQSVATRPSLGLSNPSAIRPPGMLGSHKLRVSSIDNEDEQTHLEVSELDADGLAARIGLLFQKLMDIEGAEKDDGSSLTSQDRSSTHQLSSKDVLPMLAASGAGGVTLRASDVQSLVEEKKRREKERDEAAIVIKERQMFLRAALQLLDQRESGSGDNGIATLSGAGAKAAMSKVDRAKDAIRVGQLRKYSKGSMWHANGSLRYQWHPKLVELRHGSFCYEDEELEHSIVLGLFGIVSGGHPKVIKLAVESVVCKPVKRADDAPPSAAAKKNKKGQKVYDPLDCLFEISVMDGPQRLWLAQSPSERDQWVRSINTAMIGSAGDFSFSDDESGIPRGEAYIPAAPLFKAPGGNLKPAVQNGMGLGLDMLDDDDESQSNSQGGVLKGKGGGGSRRSPRGGNSTEGAVAPYADDIAKFISIRLAVQQMSSRDAYKQLLRRLMTGSGGTKDVTVPVFYVKSSLGGNFQMASNDMLSRQTLLSLNNSQVWKDLQRDQISINGEVISGAERGAEGILGTLVRTIIEKADAIRTILRVSALNEAKRNPGAKVSTMEYPTFELSEGQVLACARDLLVLCGRTQSGGDTYFCVDSMLVSKEASNGLCFLAPLATTEPLEVTVTVVESDVRKQRQNITKATNDIADDISVELAGRSSFNKAGLQKQVDKGVKLAQKGAVVAASKGCGGLAIVLDDSSRNASPNPRDSEDSCSPRPSFGDDWENTSTVSDLTLDTEMGGTFSHTASRVLNEPLSLPTFNGPAPSVPPHLAKLNNNLTAQHLKASASAAGKAGTKDPITAIHPALRGKADKDSSGGNGANRRADSPSRRTGTDNSGATDAGRDTPSPGLFAQMTRPLSGIFGTRDRKQTLNSPVSLVSGGRASEASNIEAYVPDMCIRVNVRGVSRFRVCDTDPQDEKDATWATVHGSFQQCFFIKSNCNGRPAMSDRVVSIVVDSVNDGLGLGK